LVFAGGDGVSLSIPSLPPSAVHLWIVPLEAPETAWKSWQEVLSADEQARAARFHFERDRRRFVVTRASLRRLLASYTRSDPALLAFSYSSYNKPSLSESPTDIRFNVSHSGELALLAITHGREVGVDIEKIRPEVEAETLAERFFSPAERKALRGTPAKGKSAAFFRGWTCKEAFVKAQGMGLSLPLDCFDVELEPEKPAALLATRPDAAEAKLWSLHLVEVPDGYAAALAVQGSLGELMMLGFESQGVRN
jgi:4'-phosphopantetheinyl transferase